MLYNRLNRHIPLQDLQERNFKHIGFYPGPEAVAEFQEELKKYSVDKGTIRIPYENIDIELVKKIARWCLETGKHA